MIYLLWDALPVVRKNDRPEAAALVDVLKALTAHPAVGVSLGMGRAVAFLTVWLWLDRPEAIHLTLFGYFQ